MLNCFRQKPLKTYTVPLAIVLFLFFKNEKMTLTALKFVVLLLNAVQWPCGNVSPFRLEGLSQTKDSRNGTQRLPA